MQGEAQDEGYCDEKKEDEVEEEDDEANDVEAFEAAGCECEDERDAARGHPMDDFVSWHRFLDYNASCRRPPRSARARTPKVAANLRESVPSEGEVTQALEKRQARLEVGRDATNWAGNITSNSSLHQHLPLAMGRQGLMVLRVRHVRIS